MTIDQAAVPLTRLREAEMIAAQTTAADWVDLVRAEYLEIPGLHLTREQAKQLWRLDDVTCDAILDTLVEARFLRRTRDGAYIRADQA